MSIPIRCPGCQTELWIGDRFRGKQVRCKKCGHIFTVEESPTPESEQDEKVERQAQIQSKPQLAECSPVGKDEELISPPRRQPNENDLPTIPSLRRTYRGLLLGLVVGGLGLFLLGGTVVFAILYWGRSWGGALESLDSDFRGSWPTPTPPGGFGADIPEDTIVTLHIAAVADDNTREAVYDQAMTLADGGRGATIAAANLGDRMTILLAPARDPEACARKIGFGTVRRVNGRTISVIAHKVEGLPPDADAVTKAMHHLKSPNEMRRLEAARRLKKMVPDQRREEVARALETAMKGANFFSRQEILEALAVWGDRNSVPTLLNALAEDDNPFTHRAIFRALARFKDERACEPLAQHLEDLADRDEAATALKAMGPMAEKAVLKRLRHPDHWVSREACHLLQVIGTKESLPALEKMAANGDFFMPEEARKAIEAIKSRQNAAK